jgi:hypothetical protein
MITEEELAEWLFDEDWDKEQGWAYANELSGSWSEISPEGKPNYMRKAHSLLLFLDSKGVRVLVDEMDEHGLAHIGYERLPGVEGQPCN